MYLWKTKKLMAELQSDSVTEKDKLLYVLISSVAGVVLSDPMLTIGLDYSRIDAALFLGMLIVTVIGTIYTYRRNCEGDNKDFVTRYVCLSVPIGVRYFLLAIAGGIIVGIVEGVTTPQTLNETTFRTSIPLAAFILLLTALFFGHLRMRIGEVSRARDG